MTKTPAKITSDSLDVRSLLTELLRIQEERDRLWAEKELLREKLQLAAGERPAAPAAGAAEDLPGKLNRLAGELAAAARQLQNAVSVPEKPSVEPELERQKQRVRHLEHELAAARERAETLETQLRVMEISARGRGTDADDADVREQLAAALEREDQLLIRLHQMETTLAHRQADQLSLLEKDKQIQQLKYFLHQGALDFEKLQTRFRAMEGENLEYKHRIIDLQTQLERQQAQAKNTLGRMQEQMSRLDAKLLAARGELDASRTRTENLEDEVDRLTHMLAQAEERAVESAGQMELLRHEAARVLELTNMVAELEWERMGLQEERGRLLEASAQLQETVELLEENAAQLEERLAEESELRRELQERVDAVTAQQVASADACGRLGEELEKAQEAVRSLQNELHREKSLHAERVAEWSIQESKLRAQWEESVRECDTFRNRVEEDAREIERLRGELALAQEAVSRMGDWEKLEGECRDARRESEVLSREVELKERQIQQLSASERAARENAARLQEELAALERLRAAHERCAQDLAMRNGRIAELESQLASAQIEIQRLAGQLKAAESRSVEIHHWSEKMRNELQQVRAQLDEEIRQRQKAEGRIRGMEAQLPEIRRLFDEIEHQVDGFEDSLVLEEERTQRLNESLDSLVSSIGEVFGRISSRVREMDAQRQELSRRLEESERKLREHAQSPDAGLLKGLESTVHDLNVQLGIMEGNFLTMQVKLQNQVPLLKERIARVAQDLEILGMLNASEELRAIAEKLAGLTAIDGMS